MKVIDISTESLSAPRKETEPAPRVQVLHSMGEGDDFNQSALYASLQMGTHINTPAMVFDEEDVPGTGELSLAKVVGPVTVFTVPEGPITGAVVENYFPRNAKRVIVRAALGSTGIRFFGGAAKDIADIGYALIGFEGVASEDINTYRSLMSRGSVLLEGLDLGKVERDGEFFLFAQPMKIDGVEATPCRALLVEDEMSWSSQKSRI